MNARDITSYSLSEYLCQACFKLKPDRLAVYALSEAHDQRILMTPTTWKAKQTDPSLQQLWDQGRATFQTLTGSVAEYKARYLLTSIGDVDIMFWRNNELAMMEDDTHTHYIGLPGDRNSEELHKRIRCYLMNFVPFHPGYVTLQVKGTLEFSFETLTYRLSNKHYQNHLYPRGQTSEEMPGNHFFHGPATLIHLARDAHLKDMIGESNDTQLKTDLVDAIRCFAWPHQVSNFEQRKRNHGWPSAKTIQEVIESGCDIVCIGHPDEPLVGAEWRLSFSRAEVVLLQSWTTLQQTVYNMTRYYLKNEILKDTDNSPEIEKIMNSYLIKSEMLKLCEFRSANWWEDTDIVDICCTVFRALRKRLRKNKCCNYFIPPCNLLCHDVQDSVWTCAEAMLTLAMNKETLKSWFLERYFSYIRGILHSDSTCLNIHDASRVKLELDLLFAQEYRVYFYKGIHTLYRLVEEIHESQVSRYCNTMKEIAKIDDRVLDYIKAHAYLFVCRNVLLKREPENNSLYVINILTSMVVANQPHIIRNFPSTFSSETSLEEKYVVKSLELSDYLCQITAYGDLCLIATLLQNTLEYILQHQVSSGLNHLLAKVSLAALHYFMGTFDESTSLLSSLTIYERLELYQNDTDLNCLLYIQEVSVAVGFFRIFLFVAWKSKQMKFETRSNLGKFSHLFHILCLNRGNNHQTTGGVLKMCNSIQTYWPMDVCFQAVVKSSLNTNHLSEIFIHKNSVKIACKNLDESSRQRFKNGEIEITKRDELYEILVKLGTEHLTKFHLILANEEILGEQNLIWYHFRALYYYPKKDYEHIMNLPRHPASKKLTSESFFQDCHPSVFSECLSVCQHCIVLLDDDILQIIGLLTILNEDILDKLYKERKQWISPGFLVAYLKTQCCMKLTRSTKDIKAEYDVMINNKLMYFERIIKFFMDRKIQRYVSSRGQIDTL